MRRRHVADGGHARVALAACLGARRQGRASPTTIQNLARELTQKHKQQGLFESALWGWTTLHQRVTEYPEIVKPGLHPKAPENTDNT